MKVFLERIEWERKSYLNVGHTIPQAGGLDGLEGEERGIPQV
jgi:hypothetical protein